MTNLAIVIDMIPRAMMGAGAEFPGCMAIVTMGGVIFSALCILYLTPVIYTVFDHLTMGHGH